ncbi:MAG: hypothetical protein GF350_04685, partial [Chitinivibrionales bacterium]|nr:hypothetical protein [Chitinivibrionales bacterium]
MEEFVFGTLATDGLKLIHHRASRRGLQHGYRIKPVDPIPNQPVSIHVSVGPDFLIDHLACYYTIDGSLPKGSKGVAQTGEVVFLEKKTTNWDTFLWGYLTHWEGVIPPQPEGTIVRYQLGGWVDDDETSQEVFADWPEVQTTIELAADAFFNDQPLPEVKPGDPRQGNTFT